MLTNRIESKVSNVVETRVLGSMGIIVSLLADYSLPPILIALGIGLPSLILYIVEVVVIVTGGRRFDSAFFRLFLTRAMLNIVNYFDSYVGVRFGRLALFLPVYLAMDNFLIALSWFLS